MVQAGPLFCAFLGQKHCILQKISGASWAEGEVIVGGGYVCGRGLKVGEFTGRPGPPVGSKNAEVWGPKIPATTRFILRSPRDAFRVPLRVLFGEEEEGAPFLCLPGSAFPCPPDSTRRGVANVPKAWRTGRPGLRWHPGGHPCACRRAQALFFWPFKTQIQPLASRCF
jgi:hypothetical protein